MVIHRSSNSQKYKRTSFRANKEPTHSESDFLWWKLQHIKQIINVEELTEKQGENHQKNAGTWVENNELATVWVDRKQTDWTSQHGPEEGRKRLPERMPFLKRPWKKTHHFQRKIDHPALQRANEEKKSKPEMFELSKWTNQQQISLHEKSPDAQAK